MRPINYPGLEDYLISESGEVVGKDGVRKIRTSIISRGYKQVGLYVRGVGKRSISVHRLVALTYIPTDDTSKDVDHIDNDKLNNHVSNLQWLSRAENVAKSFKQGRIGSRKGQTMGKNMVFYINNDIEQKLREIQEAGGSMGGKVNEVLRQHFFGTPVQNTPTPKNTNVKIVEDGHIAPIRPDLPSKITAGATLTRNKGDVLADIRQKEADRDEELRFCQDPAESKNIMERYLPEIRQLWLEYHTLKEAE
jgi:hypothetical protein